MELILVFNIQAPGGRRRRLRDPKRRASEREQTQKNGVFAKHDKPADLGQIEQARLSRPAPGTVNQILH
jgi:hypothetical protein